MSVVDPLEFMKSSYSQLTKKQKRERLLAMTVWAHEQRRLLDEGDAIEGRRPA
jgi:hypothetical protein